MTPKLPLELQEFELVSDHTYQISLDRLEDNSDPGNLERLSSKYITRIEGVNRSLVRNGFTANAMYFLSDDNIFAIRFDLLPTNAPEEKPEENDLSKTLGVAVESLFKSLDQGLDFKERILSKGGKVSRRDFEESVVFAMRVAIEDSYGSLDIKVGCTSGRLHCSFLLDGAEKPWLEEKVIQAENLQDLIEEITKCANLAMEKAKLLVPVPMTEEPT